MDKELFKDSGQDNVGLIISQSVTGNFIICQ